jgi:hypothetical protein
MLGWIVLLFVPSLLGITGLAIVTDLWHGVPGPAPEFQQIGNGLDWRVWKSPLHDSFETLDPG